MTVRVPTLPFALDPLIAEAKRRMRRRRALVAAVLVLGVAAGVLATRPAGGMGSAQAAQALRQRLGGTDRYVCSHTVGPAVQGEPAWTYLCLNATHPQLSGYFVLSNGDRITKIGPAG
jgi:hypothetical protein